MLSPRLPQATQQQQQYAQQQQYTPQYNSFAPSSLPPLPVNNVLQNLGIPSLDDSSTSSLFDTMNGVQGIQTLSPLNSNPGDVASYGADMLNKLQTQIKDMYSKVTSQMQTLDENKETIKRMEQLQEKNEEILKRNQETVKQYSKELIEQVTKFTEGLDLGSSSSGAAPAAFIQKLGRLKTRAAQGAF